LYFVILNSFGQQVVDNHGTNYETGVIKIRKLRTDYLRTEREDKVLDSVSEMKKINTSYKKLYKSYTFNGFVYSNVLSYNRRIYFFSQDFSEKDKSLISNKKEKRKFWEKVKKLKRKNKIHYFKIPFYVEWNDSMKTEYSSKYKIVEFNHPETNELVSFEKTRVPEPGTSKNIWRKKVEIKMDDDSLSFERREGSSWTSVRDGFLAEVKFRFKEKNMFVRDYVSFKSIYKNKYSIQIDLKKMTTNQLTIIKNGNEKFVCDYKVKGNKIFIENPPIAELEKGKFMKSKTIIKFKIHNIWHEYKLKN